MCNGVKSIRKRPTSNIKGQFVWYVSVCYIRQCENRPAENTIFAGNDFFSLITLDLFKYFSLHTDLRMMDAVVAVPIKVPYATACTLT